MDTAPARRGQPDLAPHRRPGALFSIGDLHFAQGDGEVCGTAIEVAGAVTVRLSLHDGPAPRLPRFECPALPEPPRYGTMGIPSTTGWT